MASGQTGLKGQKMLEFPAEAENGGLFGRLIPLSEADDSHRLRSSTRSTIGGTLARGHKKARAATRQLGYQHQSSVTRRGSKTMGSRSIRFSVILLASLLVAGTLFLAACGGGTTTTSGKATGSTAATGPKYGGTLRMVAQSNGANIGWPATQAVGGALIQSYYETLIHQDSSGAPKPWLADKWTVSPDHKWVSFTIHQGIKFSDGSDLTADVVKWNLDQYKAKHPEWGSIVVTDPNTVQVNLKSWSSGTLGDFGDVGEPALYMVSEAAYKTHGQDWMTKNPVGTGPFILKSYQTDASATLVKNPTYWAKDSNGKQLPYLDGLQFTFTQDPGTILMKAQAKEIDMVITVSPGEQMADYANMGWPVLRSH